MSQTPETVDFSYSVEDWRTLTAHLSNSTTVRNSRLGTYLGGNVALRSTSTTSIAL
jgi:hypothetical protein